MVAHFHVWLTFALVGAYELLTRVFRTAAQRVRTAFASYEQTAEEDEGTERSSN
ncbi:hypothetical protein IDM40_00810 [Nocardiopsis sp. HNM0947]|uniref:Uncharacterized protein n=1 Tax=Nocardiopsis coralli TaxID=2772213 RepID=A0ABR9P097_9ACTN|nr:hypothetical protein [Nocardiopsis coralli]MBE2997246.1 hypothetical protein [Nocardiopsis coralli]